MLGKPAHGSGCHIVFAEACITREGFGGEGDEVMGQAVKHFKLEIEQRVDVCGVFFP